jgi:hypothetical protein
MTKMKKKKLRELRRMGSVGEHELFKACEKYITFGDRKLTKKLYQKFGLIGKTRRKYAYAFDENSWTSGKGKALANFWAARECITGHINSVKLWREGAAPKQYESKFQDVVKNCTSAVILSPDSEQIVFRAKYWVSSLGRKITEWRPNIIGGVTSRVALHSRDTSFRTDNCTLTYSPTQAKLRIDAALAGVEDDTHIPLIATDRFILSFVNANGEHYVPDRISDGQELEVQFISDGPEPRVMLGWLVKYATEFGCSANLSDARKAAKMRAVRKTKKALGLV